MDPTARIVKRAGSIYVSKRNLYSSSGNPHPDRRDVTLARSFFVISCVIFLNINVVYINIYMYIFNLFCVVKLIKKNKYLHMYIIVFKICFFADENTEFENFYLHNNNHKNVYLNNIVFIYFVSHAQRNTYQL